MSEIRQNPFDILEDDKKRSKSKSNGVISDQKLNEINNLYEKSDEDSSKQLDGQDETNWTPVQQSSKSRRLVPHYTLSRHDLGAESRKPSTIEVQKKKITRYSKEEIIELRKPTKILDSMKDIGDIISIKPLNPLFFSPLSSEEITRLWNYEKKNENSKDPNNLTKKSKPKSKVDDDNVKDESEWTRQTALESADGANFWDDDGLSNESTFFDLADIAAATLKFKSETLDLSSFKEMLPIQEEHEDNEDDLPEWANDDIKQSNPNPENQSKTTLLKEALNLFKKEEPKENEIPEEVVESSANQSVPSEGINANIKGQSIENLIQINSETAPGPFLQSTISFDNLINSSQVVEEWLYTDPQGNIQGPFAMENMRSWLEAGYFTPDLPVKMQNWHAFYPLAVIYPNYSESFRNYVDEPSRRVDVVMDRQRMLEEQRRAHEQQIRMEQELRIQQIQQQQLLQKQQLEEQQRLNKEAEARQRAIMEQRRQQEAYEERVRQDQVRRQQEAMLEEQRKINEQQMLYAMEKQREQQSLAEQEHRRRQEQILMERRRQDEQKRMIEQQSLMEQQRQQKLFYERQRQLQLLEEQKRHFEQNNNAILEQQRINSSSAPWAKPMMEQSKFSKASLLEIQQKEEAEMMELRRQEAIARSQNKANSGWAAPANSHTKSLLEIQIEEEQRRQALEAEQQQYQAYTMSTQLKSILGVSNGAAQKLNSNWAMSNQPTNNNLAQSGLSFRDIMKEEQNQLSSQGKEMKTNIGSWAAKASTGSTLPIPSTQSLRSNHQVQQQYQNIPNDNSKNSQVKSIEYNNDLSDFSDMPLDLAEWCSAQTKRFNNSSDVATLLQFCFNLQSAGDIREYLSANLGSTPIISQFATEFIKRREAYISHNNSNSKKKLKK